ncbi:hypothetical protein [Pseudobacteriovorax antillogorgiicola]|uniref:Lipoprotein n=1 Tax=Pseudobacteriovorax antillogorgiicola TaxID=1513793 RepID=A0A1Y6CD82_9BACT|nr:hypothetical protein [Pseudobacteriovorax antillogorgiicola]TCS47902.1 hypothetical protein EDD56_11913 [Pseudobacteriovorax antillogorgiicola]SMF57797.1 hypothetical protein SAMN06296036_11914 [Pseudobacteriovorax antillogorgiicola]
MGHLNILARFLLSLAIAIALISCSVDNTSRVAERIETGGVPENSSKAIQLGDEDSFSPNDPGNQNPFPPPSSGICNQSRAGLFRIEYDRRGELIQESLRFDMPCRDAMVECSNALRNYCINSQACSGFRCYYQERFDENWQPIQDLPNEVLVLASGNLGQGCEKP